jgi:hypothetical protein
MRRAHSAAASLSADLIRLRQRWADPLPVLNSHDNPHFAAAIRVRTGVPSARRSSLFCRCHSSTRPLPPRKRWPVSSLALPQQAEFYLKDLSRYCTEVALSQRGEIGFEPPWGEAAKALSSNILNRGADSTLGSGCWSRFSSSLVFGPQHRGHALPRSGL